MMFMWQPMSEAGADPWREGWDAAHEAAVGRGRSIDDNPYAEDTLAHRRWESGYLAGWDDEFPEDADSEGGG